MKGRLDQLAVDVAEAELVTEIDARRSDVAAGLVPEGVRRALYPHEIAARTDFAGIEEQVGTAATVIARRLLDDRRLFISLLARDLRRVGEQPGPAAAPLRVAMRVLDIDGPVGLSGVEGARAVIDAAERFHRGALEQLARHAAEALVDEAVDQAVEVEGWRFKLDPDQADHLDVAARRLAQAPHVDLVRAVREQVAIEPLGLVSVDELVDRLAAHARDLASGPVEEVARQGAQQAHGIGRGAGARDLPAPTAVYASELLDGNTCGPCSFVDGHKYGSVAGGLADYPNGIYGRCDGGPRCRGTLVLVWGEAPPSVR